jgi:hypothetical protein
LGVRQSRERESDLVTRERDQIEKGRTEEEEKSGRRGV